MLTIVEECMAVDLGLAKHVLKQLQVALILNVDIHLFLAFRAFFKAVVVLLQLLFKSALTSAALDADDKVVWILALELSSCA